MSKKLGLIFFIIAFSLQILVSQGNGGNSTGTGGTGGTTGTTNTTNHGTTKTTNKQNPNTTNQYSPNSRTDEIKDTITNNRRIDNRNEQGGMNYKDSKFSEIKREIITRLENGKNGLIDIQKLSAQLTKTIKNQKNGEEIEKSTNELILKIKKSTDEIDRFILKLSDDDLKLVKKQVKNIEKSKENLLKLLQNVEKIDKKNSNYREDLLKFNSGFKSEANIIERQLRAIEWIMFEE